MLSERADFWILVGLPLAHVPSLHLVRTIRFEVLHDDEK